MRCAACMVLLLSVLPHAGLCQSAETLKAFEKGPHVGPAQTALVGVTVTITQKDGTQTVRRGNGFVLRCDGYVLFPSSMLVLEDGKGTLSVSVTLRPGTGEAVAKAVNPRIAADYDGGLVQVKAHGVHVPALRTLLPDTLKPGDELMVVCAPLGEGGKFGPVQYRHAALGELPKERSKSPAAMLPFAAPVEDVPAGAVVTGPDGMAVGMVLGRGGSAAAKEFVTFESLNRATGCVVPVPTPEGPFEARLNVRRDTDGSSSEEEKPKAEAVDEMVDVPGGPVVLPAAWFGQQVDLVLAAKNVFDVAEEASSTRVEMERDRVACVAPFRMDRDQVTNQRYLTFWSTLPRDDRRRQAYFPLGWEPDGDPFPPGVANLPVLGVPYEGAAAYARWQGKRLPTVYEWCLAALGPRAGAEWPEWLQRYIADHSATWERVKAKHRAVLGAARGEAAAGVRKWIPLEAVTRDSLPLAEWSRKTLLEEAEGIWDRWQDPTHLAPVGSRDFDVSPYGVRDVVFGARDRVVGRLTGAGASVDRFVMMDHAPEPAPATQDPLDLWGTNFPALGHTLGRMYRRAPDGPSLEQLTVVANLWEVEQLVRKVKVSLIQSRGGDPQLIGSMTWHELMKAREELTAPRDLRAYTFPVCAFLNGAHLWGPDPLDGSEANYTVYPATGSSSAAGNATAMDAVSLAWRLHADCILPWGGSLLHYRPETGRRVPLYEMAPGTGAQPSLYRLNPLIWFVPPHGFRCAR